MITTSREQLDRFLSQRIPRVAPGEFRRALMKKSPARVFLFIGSIFLLIGVTVNYLMLPTAETIQSIKLDTGEKAAAAGVIKRIETTRMRVGKGSRRRLVNRLFFSWQQADGKVIQGICYRTGNHYQAGSKVEIEYLERQPAICRIKGCTLTPFGYAGLLFLAFPLIGFGFIITYLTKRISINRMLQYGIPAEGVISDIIATNVRVNKQQRHKVIVYYNDDNGVSREGFYYAYGNDVDAARGKWDNGSPIPLLYDRAKPKKVLPLAVL